MSDRIFVQGLQVYARHGALPEEATLGQRFVLDLAAHLDLGPAGRSDDLARSVSYAEMIAVTTRVVRDTRFALIEAVAEAVAAALLADFPAIDRIDVAVHKPGAPVDAAFADLGVAIERRRVPG